jgi:hypothetical protein
MKICPKCFIKHDKNGKYCSRTCANSRTWSEEDKHKKRLTVLKTLGMEYIPKTAKAEKCYPNETVFVEHSSYSRRSLKKRIIEQNLLNHCCQECGLKHEWNGKPIVLQLDHINGINNDHRIENLRFLCPNCHTQQDTYAAKNIKKNKIG